MNTVEILFSLLRFELKGDKLDEATKAHIDEAQLSKLYELSDAHDIAHIIGSALSKNGLLSDNEISQKFKKKTMLAAYRYEIKVAEYSSITALFEKEKIEYLLLKGQTIAKYYPQPWMRTSCDIDILISESDVERAKTLLCEKLQYEIKNVPALYDVSIFAPSGVHLELHFRLKKAFVNTEVCLEDLRRYMTQSENGRCALSFTNEYLLFYVACHAAKHFVRSGCGIRQILDLWLLEKNLEISQAILNAYADEAGMTAFLEGTRKLNEVWFGNGKHTKFTRKMEEFVLASGSYGTRENSVALGKSRVGSQQKYILQRIFVPFETLKGSYPILEKHPSLTPIMLLCKWFSTLSTKRFKRALIDMKYSLDVSNDKANEISNILEELGLSQK